MITAALRENDLNLDTAGMLELIKAYQSAVDVNIISSITDTSGKILYANRKFCAVSKYNREELIGQNHRIINSGYHDQNFFAQMWATISKGEVWHGEIRNRAKDGSTYWVETVIIPILNSQGRIYRYLSLRLLVTEKKKTEHERLDFIEHLTHILETTSHSVRAPLTTCLGLLNILKEPGIRDEERDKLYQTILQSAEKLDQFTKDLTKLLSEIQEKYKKITAHEYHQHPNDN